MNDLIDQLINMCRIGPQKVARHLAMQDRCRDIGIICRDLSPPLHAIVCSETNKRDEIFGKGFDSNDFSTLLNDSFYIK